MSTRRVKLRLEFDGAPFRGWQLQSPAEEASRPSLQGLLEKTVGVVLHQPEERFLVQGCGRTDAGVHAEEYFCHVDLPLDDSEEDLERFRHQVNSILPPEVVVTRAECVADHFHALEQVTRKTYEYRIFLRRAKPVLMRGRCWWLPLDPARSELFSLERIKRVLPHLEGTHDFVAFAAANASAKTTVRHLFRCELKARSWPEEDDAGILVSLFFEGSGFLKQMVRNLVGTLVEIGQNRRSELSILQLLGAEGKGPGRRIEAGVCAPAEGLYLVKVNYDGQDATELG